LGGGCKWGLVTGRRKCRVEGTESRKALRTCVKKQQTEWTKTRLPQTAGKSGPKKGGEGIHKGPAGWGGKYDQFVNRGAAKKMAIASIIIGGSEEDSLPKNKKPRRGNERVGK